MNRRFNRGIRGLKYDKYDQELALKVYAKLIKINMTSMLKKAGSFHFLPHINHI